MPSETFLPQKLAGFAICWTWVTVQIWDVTQGASPEIGMSTLFPPKKILTSPDILLKAFVNQALLHRGSIKVGSVLDKYSKMVEYSGGAALDGPITEATLLETSDSVTD